jgi:thiamine biosynthesis protein ThiI
MSPEFILLRFGELTLKGKNRYRFENKVLKSIHRILIPFPQTKITRAFGRLYIELNEEPYEPIASQLILIFGLVSFSPVLKRDLDLGSIRQAAVEVMHGLKTVPNTFKVTTRRTNKDFPYDTQQLNMLIGGYVLEHTPGLKVDVHHPDTELRVEIREKEAFVFSEVIPGLGGFPNDSNGKAMLMLSGGIDSPTAGWLAMKRGIQIEGVHFHSYPYTSERAKHKVIDITRQLTTYTEEIKLHLVPFTEIQTKLNEFGQDNLMITLMRRAMFRITEKLAIREEAKAIVTGESLGQVASQTLSSLNVIGRATELPILQPLITMGKDEIITIAKNIRTYPISILPYEDCCTLFQPKSPSTNPNLAVVERLEKKMEWLAGSIDTAVNQTETLRIRQEDPENHEDLF